MDNISMYMYNVYIYMYGYIIDRIISIYCSSYNDPILWRMRSSYFPTRLGRSLWPIKGWLRRDVGLRELQIIQNDGQNGYWRYWMTLMIFPSESDVFVDVDIIYIYIYVDTGSILNLGPGWKSASTDVDCVSRPPGQGRLDQRIEGIWSIWPYVAEVPDIPQIIQISG